MKQLAPSDRFAAYRLPNATQRYLVIQNKQKSDSDHAPFFLIGDFQQNEQKIVADDIYVDTSFKFYPAPSADTFHDISKADYCTKTNQIIADIKAKKYKKLVFSRTKTLRHAPVDVHEIFDALCHAYPTALVFCYHTPEGGCWIGATPESLLRCTDLNTYHTMALAGTQAKAEIPSEQITWGPKEKEEQNYLVKYVCDTLNDKGIDFEQLATRTLDTGSLYHICTDFIIRQDSLSFTDLARTLHPGPAISGYPVADVLPWITHYEPHSRGDYSGYLGPVGIDGREELYINLRSMQVSTDTYRLYLGGGLTADSDPASEWAETELKAKTLLNYLPQQIKGQ